MRVKARRLGGVVGIAIVVMVLSAPAALVQAALAWQTETVESADNVGQYTSLALDSQGQPHISYYDWTNEDLKYATFNGAIWQIETIDTTGTVGWDTSLALDGAGQPHISYFYASNQDLKYATFDGSSWQTMTVDAEGVTGRYNSLALDSAGQPHISYYDGSNGYLKYASFDGSAWQTTTVDTAETVGLFPALAFDSSDRPHISYLDAANGSLKYARFDGSGWQFETVDSDKIVGWHTSLVLDGNDRPHISYYDATNARLKYTTFDGVNWQTETIDEEGDVGRTTSLALDGDGRPHISYWDASNGNLKYATLDNTGWHIEPVDEEGSVGRMTSLALDSDGQPHISYYDNTNDDLKYTKSVPNQPPMVETGGPYSGDEGSPVSLQATATDPDDDDLTTVWSYEADTADDGTACSFADSNQVETTFTCTDDGSFTLTLEASDGINPPVTATADVTFSNADPTIGDVTATVSHAQVTITVDAADPGQNDVLGYAFDCTNDGGYEVAPQPESSTTCPINPQQEGTFTFGVQVADDDGETATDTVTVTIATEMCASNYTSVLRYADACRDYETAATIPGEGPVTVCASTHNGLLRSPLTGSCAGHETSYELPEDGPLSVCVSTYTQTMRAVDDLGQCSSHEYGRVIAATEIGETRPPR